MPYDANEHRRRSIRLPGHDYASPGAYFVTICVQGGECLLGEVVDGEMRLNEWGQIAAESWQRLDAQYPYVALDAWVIMPNHMHGVIVLQDHDVPGTVGRGGGGRGGGGKGGSRTAPTKRKPLGRLVGAFKTVSTKRISKSRGTPGTRFWQRNYWEHIVRVEPSLNRIREYIQNNPTQWAEDQLHPDAPPNAFNRWQPQGRVGAVTVGAVGAVGAVTVGAVREPPLRSSSIDLERAANLNPIRNHRPTPVEPLQRPAERPCLLRRL